MPILWPRLSRARASRPPRLVPDRRLALGARLTSAGAAKIIDQLAMWNASNPEHVTSTERLQTGTSHSDGAGAAERMVLPEGLVKPAPWALALPPKGKNT